MVYLFLLLGFALLIAGGETFVRGAVAIAERLGMSPLLIGLTLMGFGTSLPEMLTSVQAALEGAPGISVGNVVGSNIANILLILGATALIFPVVVDKSVLKRDGTVLALSSLVALAVVWFGYLDRLAGVILIVLLAGYLVLSYVADRNRPVDPGRTAAAEDVAPPRQALWLSLLLAIGGLAMVVVGARFLVDSAVELAGAFGVSETVIGLTVVAIGTSLPELVTGVIAAIRRHTELALGNVIGSNIFNILAILGVTAVVQPIPVPPEIMALDIWVMLAATALMIGFSISGNVLKRWEGGVFLALYAGYMGWLALAGSVPAL